MVMLAKIRRMHFRDGMSVREVSRRTGLSRNTVRRWLRQGAVEPVYPARKRPCIIDAYRGQLEVWLRTDSHRLKRDRRTAKVLFHQLQAQGFPGGYGRVAEFVRRWRAGGGVAGAKPAFVPLYFFAGRRFPIRLELRVRRHRRIALSAGGGAREGGEMPRTVYFA